MTDEEIYIQILLRLFTLVLVFSVLAQSPGFSWSGQTFCKCPGFQISTGAVRMSELVHWIEKSTLNVYAHTNANKIFDINVFNNL